MLSKIDNFVGIKQWLFPSKIKMAQCFGKNINKILHFFAILVRIRDCAEAHASGNNIG
jgi:hypothetical protein